MLEKDAKPTARSCLKDSQNRLAKVLRAGRLGRGQTPVEVGLG